MSFLYNGFHKVDTMLKGKAVYPQKGKMVQPEQMNKAQQQKGIPQKRKQECEGCQYTFRGYQESRDGDP